MREGKEHPSLKSLTVQSYDKQEVGSVEIPGVVTSRRFPLHLQPLIQEPVDQGQVDKGSTMGRHDIHKRISRSRFQMEIYVLQQF